MPADDFSFQYSLIRAGIPKAQADAINTAGLGSFISRNSSSTWAGTTITFTSSGGAITLTSGTVGSIQNMAIGTSTPAAGNFSILITSGTVRTSSSATLANSARAIDTTASATTSTLANNKVSHYIKSPAATITVTLPVPTADGERIRITFGAATTVTWAVQAPATAVDIPKTSFAAGDSIELVYNSTAGSPPGGAATTWYPH